MSTTKQEQEALPLKMKKPSYKRPNDDVFKLDLTNKPEETTEEKIIDEVKEEKEINNNTEKEKEVVEDKQIVEITEVEKPKDEIIEKVEETKIQMPENIEKLVSFMNETGGSIDDYSRLNADYSNVDPNTLLKEYYKNSKPHLDSEEIDFLIEDRFSYDDEVDDEIEVKKKKLEIKEEVAKARNFLEETKSKYYAEIKLKSDVNPTQQKAMDFFDRYRKEQESAQKQHGDFTEKTNNYFNNDFEGFKFNVGEKTFNYNVKNPDNIAKNQSNIKSFLGKFLGNTGEVNDLNGYHKAIYTASNADSIAEHFYEQGKTDAIKNINAKSKNISNDPRPQDNGDVFINGFKVKAVNGVDSTKLKFKTKTKN